ncbi:hypothetical protein B296_00003469 [Ensete ventricosum]|uniref:Uncharacterized protein n=1 Tax=Ensete ventricosum TaxID=4639 RepID=A0A427BB21_ENSVE|nr:hypothetical protein B296_00003469 [Ensete ventricosum]
MDCLGSLTASYRAVPPKSIIGDRFRPSAVDFNRRWSIEMVSAKGRRKKKREKKILESDAALRPHDPSPAGNFFSPRKEME